MSRTIALLRRRSSLAVPETRDGAIKKPGSEVATLTPGFLNINLVSSADLRQPIQFRQVRTAPHNCHAVDPKVLVTESFSEEIESADS